MKEKTLEHWQIITVTVLQNTTVMLTLLKTLKARCEALRKSKSVGGSRRSTLQ